MKEYTKNHADLMTGLKKCVELVDSIKIKIYGQETGEIPTPTYTSVLLENMYDDAVAVGMNVDYIKRFFKSKVSPTEDDCSTCYVSYDGIGSVYSVLKSVTYDMDVTTASLNSLVREFNIDIPVSYDQLDGVFSSESRGFINDANFHYEKYIDVVNGWVKTLTSFAEFMGILEIDTIISPVSPTEKDLADLIDKFRKDQAEFDKLKKPIEPGFPYQPFQPINPVQPFQPSLPWKHPTDWNKWPYNDLWNQPKIVYSSNTNNIYKIADDNV